jgi:DHA2 family multidrug resistance protein
VTDATADGAHAPGKSSASARPSASLQDWIAVIAGSLGALIASLDISIVNSALPQIQGEIGASGTEGTWISTGYLVSEVVMIPLAAWLTRVLGLRTLLLLCGGLFTVFSMVCGVAHDLPTMILGRVGQGFFGGALIPTAQTIVRTRLPPRQMPIGMTIFGLIVLLGPLLGPVIGGWLTESASWRWCFFLNLPIAGGLIALLLLGLPHEKSRLGQFVRADWLGIVGMTAGLSCLTVVLEEGQRDRWFESGFIVLLSVISVIGFVALGIAQATVKQPVIKLRLMLNRSYASVILIIVVVGMVLYGILYVLPQFLSIIAGYNSEQSGRILAVSGIPAFLMMPILPLILGKAPLRLTVLLGLMCFALSCFLDIGLTADTSGDHFVISQLLRGVGQILAFMPLNQASVGSVPPEDAADAAGLYNMARNLGGSLGLALLGVFIDRRVEAHADYIGQAVTQNSELAQSRLAGQAAGFAATNGGDMGAANMQALSALNGTVHQQAMIITYSECFWILGIALIGLMPLVFLLKAPPKGSSAAEMAH